MLNRIPEPVYLTSYMRSLLSREIFKQISDSLFRESLLNLRLHRESGDTFTGGSCPFCGEKGALVVEKSRGVFHCTVCRQQGDCLTLMGRQTGLSLDSLLAILSKHLEDQEKGGAV